MAIDVGAFSALARTEFQDGLLEAHSRVMHADFDMFVTTMPSTVKIESHTFMSALPSLYEFKGYSPGVRLEDLDYTITNKDYRIGPIKIKETDLEDNVAGGYLKSIKALPAKGQVDIGRKILSHISGGTTNTCFDGSAMFANSHTVGSGDNLETYDCSGNDGVTHKVILMRTDNPFVKPIVFQDRKSLTALQDDIGPEAYKKKEFEYWADCRFGLGLGYWWDASHCTITDTPTLAECYLIFEQMWNNMKSFTLPKGREADDAIKVHDGWDEPNESNCVLLCSTKVATYFRRALKITQYVTSTGNVDNVYQGAAKIISTSALD